MQKDRHFAKRKTICVSFYIQNPDNLRYVIFIEFLKRQTQTFPSGGGMSCVHGSTMRRASLAISINALLTHPQEVGHLAFTDRQRTGRSSPSLFLSQNIVYLFILYLIRVIPQTGG